MTTTSKGFVALFPHPLTQKLIQTFVQSWLDRFDHLEQIPPGDPHGTATLTIQKPEELMWENHLQFRILHQQEFAWIYLSLNRPTIETTGLPSENIPLCLECLLELPDVAEIIDQHNDRRLDQLEAEGLL